MGEIETRVKTVLIIVPVLIVIGFGTGTKFVRVRRDLAAQREAISQGWTRVDAALQERADLLPDLVDTMKGAAEIENPPLKDIADARAALAGARSPLEKIQANDRLSAALGRLLLLSENYPQLRTAENFRRIQDAIAEKENDIAVER